MSKSHKLLNEIILNDEISSSIVDKNGKPGVIFDIGAAVRIIEKHMRDVHDEAVAATIMACNKKQFAKPNFVD